MMRADIAQAMWDAYDALEGDEHRELRARLDAAADFIYQHESEEWSDLMRSLLFPKGVK